MAKKTKTQKKTKSHHHKKISHFHKIVKTKRKTKDVDQIHEDLKRDNAMRLLNQEVDIDLPGSGQHYCLHCARYFKDATALNTHNKTKIHKRQVRNVKMEPYTQEEANRAAGIGSYIKPQLAVHDNIDDLLMQ